MILADKIIDLRKKNGWSQEELAEKLSVSRQAVSKWEGAQSVPDMARVLQMSELFGVSTDYLLKDSLEKADPAEEVPSDSLPVRAVGMEEANAFLAAREVNARHIALGVLLCILSPICLILLCGAREFGYVPLSEAAAAGMGVAILLLMVGGAVALFVTSGLRTGRFAYLDALPIDTLYGVDGMARERREQFRPTRDRQLTLGIVLCVLAMIPVFLSLVFYGEEDHFGHLVAVVLLLMVGGAVALFVTSGLRTGRFEYLDALPIDTLYGVDGMARERREQFRPTRDRQLTLGIVLCVLAVIPVFLSLVLYGEEDHFGHLIAVALLLVLVGIGVLLIVRSSILWGSYQRLLEEGDYSRAGKEASRVAAPFNSIYWGLVTAGFLAWGFLGSAWDRCWIIWPVAAVAYGAIYGIVGALRRK